MNCIKRFPGGIKLKKKKTPIVIKVTNQLALISGDYSGLTRQTQYNHMSPKEEKRKAGKQKRPNRRDQ